MMLKYFMVFEFTQFVSAKINNIKMRIFTAIQILNHCYTLLRTNPKHRIYNVIIYYVLALGEALLSFDNPDVTFANELLLTK